MKVKTKLLQEYLDKQKMTAKDLAGEIEISVIEIEKMLNGEAVDEKTALRFICYFGASEAQRFIDWDAIGKQNPFSDEE